jgi:UDP-N-acetylglucosamine 2-epimerase (non-hydrolysing)
LAAAKLQIPVGHIEAGLRSYDRSMPEEVNRVIADHISNYLFAPTEKAARVLINEGIAKESIFVTGNTIVDAVYRNIEIARRKSKILEKLGLEAGRFFLVTAHRQENVDKEDRLRNIFEGLRMIAEKYRMPLIYPIHPRTRKRVEEFGLSIPSGVVLSEPVGYLDFLSLESRAALVLTDSGGVQEETCILQVPCVTLRDNTERPETIEVGSNLLAGVSPEKIMYAVEKMLKAKRNWPNPFGDGKSGERIAGIIEGTRKIEAAE